MVTLLFINSQLFIFFLSPERKPNQKKECENVLSSEAGCPIIVIIR